MGTLDPSTIDESWTTPPPTEKYTSPLQREKPPLRTLLSSYDFEAVARNTLTAKTWAFYSSAATDLITAKANKSFFDRVWFRPRILKDVRRVDTGCTIQGIRTSLPLFVSPASLAKMVHPTGERGIAAACASKGIIQCVRQFYRTLKTQIYVSILLGRPDKMGRKLILTSSYSIGLY